jgi:hypothetical protein
MTDDLDVQVLGGEALRNLAGPVAATIVNYDNFEVVRDARTFG